MFVTDLLPQNSDLKALPRRQAVQQPGAPERAVLGVEAAVESHATSQTIVPATR
jgi:hypothetical protein